MTAMEIIDIAYSALEQELRDVNDSLEEEPEAEDLLDQKAECEKKLAELKEIKAGEEQTALTLSGSRTLMLIGSKDMMNEIRIMAGDAAWAASESHEYIRESFSRWYADELMKELWPNGLPEHPEYYND